MTFTIGARRASELIDELEESLSTSHPMPSAVDTMSGKCPWCGKDITKRLQSIDWSKAKMKFQVARRGASVSAQLYTPQTGKVQMQAYAWMSPLLALAEQRMRDIERGKEDSAAGWMSVSELGRRIRRDRLWLNTALLRGRKALESFGADAVQDIVERRPTTRELRIAVSALEIVRI